MAMSCDISHDGRFVLSCSDLDNAIVIWDLRQEKSIKVMKREEEISLFHCTFLYRVCQKMPPEFRLVYIMLCSSKYLKRLVYV